MKIDAGKLQYRELNEQIHRAITGGETEFQLTGVCGQRYIGCGLTGGDVRITIDGTPGNDMAAFMDGPEIVVKGNVQDGTANTMNHGRIIVHGHAGDVLGYAMRGGTVFVRGNVGYRTGIHMKAYEENFPVLVVGGRAGDFLGEYMAGGVVIVLGHNEGRPCGRYTGTGMHGGSIFLPPDVDRNLIASTTVICDPDEEDLKLYRRYVNEFLTYFPETGADSPAGQPFIKVIPRDVRPYAAMYAH